MDNNKKTTSGEMGFIGFLQILFIALKLLNKITWKWIWVLSPTWITAIVVVLILIIALLLTNRRN